MKKIIHPIAGTIALLTIATFWLSTAATELFGSTAAVVAVKTAIPWGFLLLVPAMAAAGGTGIGMVRGRKLGGVLKQKAQRMPIIAANGILVLIPAALFLAARARSGNFDGWFYAVQVIEHMLPPESLDGVHIFFPDPWHKKKHNKRRLIQTPFLAKLVTRLKPGGYIHCATDWEPYAQQMLEVLGAEPQLRNSTDGFAPRPSYRPTTKFEKRGLRLGHGVWDLIFLKRPTT